MPNSYTINSGDSLWGLASKYGGGGQNWKALQDANPGIQPNSLQVGSKINLPSTWTASQSSTQSQPAQTNDSSTPNKQWASGANTPGMGFNLQSNLDTAKGFMQPALNTLNTNFNNSTGAINSAYDASKTQGNALINNINGSTNGMIANEETARGNVNNAIQRQADATKAIMQRGQDANLGAVTAKVVASGFGGTTAAQTAGGVQPFVQSEIEAANQPYRQDLEKLNADTAYQIASSNANILGLENQLKTASNQQITSIGMELMKLAPEQAQTIAALNTDMAKTNLQYQQGVLDEATALGKIQQDYGIQQQQIANAKQEIANNYQVGMANASANMISARASQTSAGAAQEQADAAMKMASRNGLIPVQSINQATNIPEVQYIDPTTGKASFTTPDPNHEIWGYITGKVNSNAASNGGGTPNLNNNSSNPILDFLGKTLGGAPSNSNPGGNFSFAGTG